MMPLPSDGSPNIRERDDLGTDRHFRQSTYRIGDLQLFRDADHAHLAPHAGCLRGGAGGGRAARSKTAAHARLYIVLAGALAVAADADSGMADGTISRILPGESVGEQSVLDESANLAAISAIVDTELLVIDGALVWKP
jgi:CRP-like cAMP-binding protein